MGKKKHNPAIHTRLDKIELALYGKNGRGGMVKDVNDIKAHLSIFRSFVVPIAIGVITAFITAIMVSRFPL